MLDSLHAPPSLRAPSATPCPKSCHTALQQSALWAGAANVGFTPLFGRDVLVLRSTLPVFGTAGLISRADLGLDASEARALRAELGLRHVAINAETPADERALAAAGFHRLAPPRQVAELGLSPCTDIMAARLHGKWRNRLRHGQAQGLTIQRRPMSPDARHWLFRREHAQARALRYRGLPAEFVVAMIAQETGAGQMFTAYHLGQKIAAMLFLRHGDSATYQIGWVSEDGRKRSAGPALMWRAMVELSQMGVARIDLGASDPDGAPGLTRFKLGTGAKLRALGGTWADSAWLPRLWS